MTNKNKTTMSEMQFLNWIDSEETAVAFFER